VPGVFLWEEALLFVNKNRDARREAKDSFESGSWALVFSKPMAQIQKSFCAAFCKKRPLSDEHAST
jgi:hypothetical protein